MIVCQNCGHEGNEKFCSRCGQLLEVGRISVPHLLHEVIHTLTHFEKGYLYTLKELALRPGIMQKKYLAGIRLHFQKPFPMFTISASLGALALYFIYKNASNVTEDYFFKNYYFVVQAAMLPFYAFVTYILFYSPRLYYAESLVLNGYMVAFMSLIIIPINCFSFILNNGLISVIEFIFLLVYNLWTFLNFFSDKNRWWVILKTIAGIFVSYLMFQYVSRLVMAWFM